MRLLADENQHADVVARLRAEGHAVEWIAETAPGASDAAILSRPDIANLVLLTYDRDFGDLIFNRGYPSPAAILYTRLNRVEPDQIADRLASLLERGIATGQMITIKRDGEKSRPFPPGVSDG